MSAGSGRRKKPEIVWDALRRQWRRWIQAPDLSWGTLPSGPPRERWHVIESGRLMQLLRRAYEGENPDLLYIEEYVNAEREDVESE